MNSIPQQKLYDLIARYGDTLHNDPHRCEALLRDLCGKHGAYPKEISLIRQAQDQGIIHDMLNSKIQNQPYKTIEAKWTRTLREDYALAEDAAQWTVETWAKALGVIPESQPGNTSSTALNSLREFYKEFVRGFTGEAKPSSQQPTESKLSQKTIWSVVGLASVLLIIGLWAAEVWRQELERQEAERQEEQRKATIDEAYGRLVCGSSSLVALLLKEKPDYIYSDGTRYYGPMRFELPLLEGSALFEPIPFKSPFLHSRTMIFSNGSRYDGNFKDRKRSGCGIFKFNDGNVYVGQFANDKFNGVGLLTTADKSRYIGDFENGQCHGTGVFISSENWVYSGNWVKNSLEGSSLQCGL